MVEGWVAYAIKETDIKECTFGRGWLPLGFKGNVGLFEWKSDGLVKWS